MLTESNWGREAGDWGQLELIGGGLSYLGVAGSSSGKLREDGVNWG